MGILILRLGWGLYFLGIAILLLNWISVLMFTSPKPTTKEMISRFLITFIWPLCLFSKGGRQTLLLMTRRI